jgi:hypothetical protein
MAQTVPVTLQSLHILVVRGGAIGGAYAVRLQRAAHQEMAALATEVVGLLRPLAQPTPTLQGWWPRASARWVDTMRLPPTEPICVE